MKGPLWFVILFVLIACSACSTLSRRIHPPTIHSKTAESEVLRSELSHRNASLRTFKGTGKVIIFQNGKSYSSKVAWLGSAPEKLRVELFGSPGQPKIGFSCDGKWLYYYDHNDKTEPVKRIPTSDSGLQRFISIKITSKDIVSILSGRIPEYKYHSSEILKAKSREGYVLVLHKKWWMGSQKIYLGANRQKIESVEMYSGTSLVYRIEFNGVQSVKSYHIPKRIVVTNGEGNRFQLDIKRFWADAAVSSDLFVLKPPTP